jgi:hypothetical protein
MLFFSFFIFYFLFFYLINFLIFSVGNKTPGPGEYTPKVNIDGTGIMYLSRYKSSTSKSMAGRARELSNKNVTPGPGAYSAFSEFGIADSKYAKRYRESQEKRYSCERSHRHSMSNGFIKTKKESFNRNYGSFDKENNDREDFSKYFEDNGEVKNIFI